MNRERVVAVVVALACVASMGVASTTLESSLTSNPDDAIELDYDTLPIGREDAAEVKQEVERNEANEQSQSSSSSSSSASASASSSSSSSSSASSDSSSQTDERSLLDIILALLEALLPYLIGALVVLTVVGLAYRYRRRLVAPFLALVSSSERDDGGDDGERVEWRPQDDVEAAWHELVQAAGVNRPHAKTPAECADEAVAAGYDPDAVYQLRRAFEDVRYGEMTLTDDHREQVARSRRELGLGGSR
ncbi:protein of unknown function [Halogranum amylolyticum]|uniref:Protein-glutamine gamma-glutamyltransferase-like C-terminal domain-containing protein n=1 Tax=Halogranum amylolyticum TaxID=660520 RepID=A0A1H8WK08_9EURY|nr:DUF4129 domain-containing protein [Halogranum amylolyticum]SEP27995.1 protein of unknown function [Halogranum amylolyticum]